MNSTDVVTDPAMKVSCYIFGADQDGADNAIAQAKEWLRLRLRLNPPSTEIPARSPSPFSVGISVPL